MPENYLRFWGVRGSYPAPFASHMKIGGNTPCVELRLGEHTILFDAGTGVIPFAQARVADSDTGRLSVFLTHYHWDHISGLPFFIPAFLPGYSLDFYGPAESPAELEEHIAQQMRAPYFPVETETWLASIRYHTPHYEPVVIGPARISAFVLHHPGLTYGYRIEVNGKVILYCPDNEIFFVNRRIDSIRDEFDESERELLEEMKAEQRGRVTNYMRDADVLIHDAQYTEEDYERKRGWGHSCYTDTVASAMEANVKNLYLFSYDPNYNDTQVDKLHINANKLIADQQSSTICHKTCEGLVINLDE
jgi:phosphoribosyl 1,2-cyclic phosphodiesterase